MLNLIQHLNKARPLSRSMPRTSSHSLQTLNQVQGDNREKRAFELTP
jgi:hypothetical protein